MPEFPDRAMLVTIIRNRLGRRANWRFQATRENAFAPGSRAHQFLEFL
jgi:hypothetical protein